MDRELLKLPWTDRPALPLKDGCLPVPDGAGIVVEFDHEEMREYRLYSGDPLP